MTPRPGAANGDVPKNGSGIAVWIDGVPGSAEKNDGFGWSLSAGDTNGDGYADIAVGANSETIGSARPAGTVTVLRASASGLTGSGAQSFSQATAGARPPTPQEERPKTHDPAPEKTAG